MAEKPVPRIVCLCGSMRFEAEMRQYAATLSLSGVVVLMPHVNGKTTALSAEQKARLDTLHLTKIDMADSVVVVTRDGYIGDSTRAEIRYAEAAGKSVVVNDFGPAGQNDLSRHAEHAARIIHDVVRGRICPDDQDPIPYGRAGSAIVTELVVPLLDKARAEVERIQTERNAEARRHEVDRAFHKLALSERDHAWMESGRLRAEVERLRAEYDQAVRDWSLNDQQVLAENQRLAVEVEQLRAALSSRDTTPSQEGETFAAYRYPPSGVRATYAHGASMDDAREIVIRYLMGSPMEHEGDAEDLADELLHLLYPDGPGICNPDEDETDPGVSVEDTTPAPNELPVAPNLGASQEDTTPEPVPDHLVVTRTDRGFGHLPKLTNGRGEFLAVYESSNANGPHLWVNVSVYGDSATAEVTLDTAGQLRDQLDYLIANHYQVAPVSPQEDTTPAPGSDNALYLQIVREHGPCVCKPGSCTDDACPVCDRLDPEWSCPYDEDADYPPVPVSPQKEGKAVNGD